MFKYIVKSIWLLIFTIVICCVIYPAVLWGIGQTVFPFQANGSIVKGPNGAPVGSLLIAQPFTKDEYFQPRPSAASYDASASSSSALAPSNYALRGRVASTLGPIVTYKGGAKNGEAVGPDIELWFQQDKFGGSALIVAQWADLHNGMAQAWVTADPTHGAYVDEWAKSHADVVAQFIKDNPDTPQPKAPDLAVVFFKSFSKDNPGKFPMPVTKTTADGKSTTAIEPVKEGSDIRSNFFDMWRQDNAEVALQDVPGDFVTTSGSGLDPHITLDNAMFQLDRVSGKWAADSKRDAAEVRKEIEGLLQENASAPFGGLAGEKIINVLQVNLELTKKYGPPS